MINLLSLHPSSESLEEYAMNRLTESQTAYVEEHMLLCASCCEALTAIDEEIRLIRTALGSSGLAAQSAMQA